MNKIPLLLISLSLLLGGCSSPEQSEKNNINIIQSPPVNESLLPKEKLAQPERKKRLDLTGQGLTAVPEYVFQMDHVEELILSNNQITGAIQAEIRNLKNLKVLNVSNNLMTGLPAEIGQLQNLQVLDFSKNQITGLPHELGNLKKLKILSLSKNDYSEHDLEIILKGLSETVIVIK